MPRLDLSVGDEVAHSTLGEGTVIALSGDGTVTVRFREDGSERRLVLGYAPLTKI
jgi:DNA helicase-2/ATP-dependent DNA helicase PcrA